MIARGALLVLGAWLLVGCGDTSKTTEPKKDEKKAEVSTSVQGNAADALGSKGKGDEKKEANHDKEPKADAPADGAVAQAPSIIKDPENTKKISVINIHHNNEVDPNLYVPCVKVKAKIFEKDEKNEKKDFFVSLKLKYPSNGQTVTKTFDVALKDLRPHTNQRFEGFIVADTTIDLGDARPDADATFSGKVKLFKGPAGESQTVVEEGEEVEGVAVVAPEENAPQPAN